jgi:hypothetical protein
MRKLMSPYPFMFRNAVPTSFFHPVFGIHDEEYEPCERIVATIFAGVLFYFKTSLRTEAQMLLQT